MNASAPVTSQLTEALPFRQREQPSAIYHQALSELQSLSATPAASQSGSDITFDLKTFIRLEISSAFKELQAAITPNISLCTGEAKPDGYGLRIFHILTVEKAQTIGAKLQAVQPLPESVQDLERQEKS